MNEPNLPTSRLGEQSLRALPRLGENKEMNGLYSVKLFVSQNTHIRVCWDVQTHHVCLVVEKTRCHSKP